MAKLTNASSDAGPNLHMIKLSVGSENIESLEAWQRARCADRRAAGGDDRPMHVTRMYPKRAEELLAGGSIYWVIQRFIQARQRFVEIKRVTGLDGINRCALILDPEIIRVEPRPRKPFQGWRYFQPKDVPTDMTEASKTIAEMPKDMQAALRAMGIV